MTDIKVAQDSGQVRVSRAGETAQTYDVQGGVISVEEHDVAEVLRVLPGAELVQPEGEQATPAPQPVEQLPTPAELGQRLDGQRLEDPQDDDRGDDAEQL